MTDFFRERTAALKMVLEMREGYRRRYYHGDCGWDSRGDVVKWSEAEKIENISPSEIGAAVVTSGNGLHRSLYHVKSSSNDWLIQEVDAECSSCRIAGIEADCVKCGGTGWQSWKRLVKCNEEFAHEPARPTIDEELEGRSFHDPAVEEFMATHFRERTSVLKKEVEIHASYAKRFCAPEFDWTRSVVSFKQSEAERIVSVVPADTGVQVTTHGFGFYGSGLRYGLRPAGQGWLIWEVNTECPVCVQQGKKAGCFWCGGSGWDDAQAEKWRSGRK